MKQLSHEASLGDWVTACAIAWRFLCYGEHGAEVRRGEAFVCAISRVAGRTLILRGYGRPLGPVRDDWAEAAEKFASQTPCSADGKVATFDGRKCPEQLRRAKKRERPIIVKPDMTPRFVLDDGTVLT